jgi:CheY-like chemotaxis protein
LKLITESRPFDVILLDLQLADVDSFDLARSIRELPAGARVPLMPMTSKRLRSDDPRPRKIGSSISIHKPIRPHQLLGAIREALSLTRKTLHKSHAEPLFDSGFAQQHPLRLLLADDNRINQKVGLHILQKLGYKADLATNGREVLQALERQQYDLVLLDLQMPEIDGLETTRQILERWPAEHRPRIIAMTGNVLLGDRERCLAAGMNDHISKPIRVTELKAALRRWSTANRSPENTAGQKN